MLPERFQRTRNIDGAGNGFAAGTELSAMSKTQFGWFQRTGPPKLPMAISIYLRKPGVERIYSHRSTNFRLRPVGHGGLPLYVALG